MNFMQSVQSRNRNSSMRKSVEDLLAGSQDVLGSSISSAISFTSGTVLQASPLLRRRSPSPSSTTTDGNRNSSSSKEHSKSETHLIVPALPDRPEGADETRIRQPEEKQNPSDIVPLNPLNRSASQEIERP
uniref:Uncharacterized protein n=1 Tax=Phlebotomus papatasi TaxID=29031 RepID=A0A1B0D2N8_PHLPP